MAAVLVAHSRWRWPEPAPFTTLDEAQLGGLGVPLIKRLSKFVSYSRIGAHNRIDLTVAAD